MSGLEGRRSVRAAPALLPLGGGAVDSVQMLPGRVPSGVGSMLYYSMKHRTQLYLDEGQYRWLKQRAGEAGSIAAVVRDLIDAERTRGVDPVRDPLLSYLVEEAPGKGRKGTSVSSLDRDLYGS
jgi:hypothetical protein